MQLFRSVASLARFPRIESDRGDDLLTQQLLNAITYPEWCIVARQVDLKRGITSWCEEASTGYDAVLTKQRIETLKKVIETGDVVDLMNHIRADSSREMYRIPAADLLQFLTGTKRAFEDYIELMASALSQILSDAAITTKDKYIFFTNLSVAHGRTALVLCGTSTLGVHHIGVLKALHGQSLLPHVICGVNTGALVAAIACAFPDEEIPSILDFSTRSQKISGQGYTVLTRRAQRFIEHGFSMDTGMIKTFLQSRIGDMTFMESYQRTGRILNIICNHSSSQWLLNYVTAPHVIVWSAVGASNADSGCSNLFCINSEGVPVTYKPWGIAGSGDVSDTENERAAWSRLCELFDVNHLIVSNVRVPSAIPPSITTKMSLLRTVFDRVVEVPCRCISLLSSSLPLVSEFLPQRDTAPFEVGLELAPVSSLWDCVQLLLNPQDGVATQCVINAERHVWPKLNALSLVLRVETVIADCTKEAKLRMMVECPNHMTLFTQELALDLVRPGNSG
jgi:hypothetical protein